VTERARALAVVGLGYGDEGKGTTVHWLAHHLGAHAVVRTGGPQAFHRVVTAAGAEHVFSQFGSATLLGVPAHLSRHMVIDPDAILNEGQALQYEHGLRNAFDHLTIHEDALVITPYHGIANRVRELARGRDRRGTVGIGVGETVLDAAVANAPVVRARDLASPRLRSTVEAIRDRKLRALAPLVEEIAGPAQEQARGELRALADPETVDWAVERFASLAARVRVVDTAYLAGEILGRPGAVIFEGSQGALLDPEGGFAPYVTQVRTTPVAPRSLLEECGFEGDLEVLGVMRAYHTRHGAGPFVTECRELTGLLPDRFNGDHPWQGSFRVGACDLVALRHAVEVCGGRAALRGLVVTCVDRVQRLGTWRWCDSYRRDDGARIQYLAGVSTAELFQCRPEEQRHTIEPDEDFPATLAGMLRERVGVAVAAVSAGETERDKVALSRLD
jgi:adenylosuccinate synthase